MSGSSFLWSVWSHLAWSRSFRRPEPGTFATLSLPSGIKRGRTIDRAVTKASQSLRGLDWFEVSEIRGHIEGGSVAHYQVTLKVGFRLED